MRFFTPQVRRVLIHVFLIFWPLVAMLALLKLFLDGTLTLRGSWGIGVPIAVFATVIGIYYPAAILYEALLFMQKGRGIPRNYHPLSAAQKALFAVPAALVVCPLACLWLGIIPARIVSFYAIVLNDGFLSIMFIYYPILTLFTMFASLRANTHSIRP